MDKNIEVLSRKIATAFSEFAKGVENEGDSDLLMPLGTGHTEYVTFKDALTTLITDGKRYKIKRSNNSIVFFDDEGNLNKLHELPFRCSAIEHNVVTTINRVEPVLREVEFTPYANKGDFDYIKVTNSNVGYVDDGMYKVHWGYDYDETGDKREVRIIDNDGDNISIDHLMYNSNLDNLLNRDTSIRAFKELEV